MHFAKSIDGQPATAAWTDVCKRFPYTRVPLGCQLGNPSLIDFGVSTRGVLRSGQGSWVGSPSDHCFLKYEFACGVRTAQIPRRHFFCRDWADAVSFTTTNWPDLDFGDPNEAMSGMTTFLHEVRDRFQAGGSAALRRENRMPLPLRLAYHRLNSCQPHERDVVRKFCWSLRLKWFNDLRTAALRTRIDRSEVVSKKQTAA